jgi:hypothetical protein
MAKTPSYRQRPGYPKALVTLTDSETGKRRDYWLGEHGTAQSREAYHCVIAAWEAGGRRLPEVGEFTGTPGGSRRRGKRPGRGDASGVPEFSVNDIVLTYWRWAKSYYHPREAATARVVLRLLRRFYGTTPAASFGPKKLRLVRDAMVRGDTGGADGAKPSRSWSRKYINHQCGRILRVFKWAAAQELVPASVYEALRTMEPLKRGRCEARGFGLEHAPVTLGHSSAEITEAVYAERDIRKAIEVARRVG